jgi:hypothetical protein
MDDRVRGLKAAVANPLVSEEGKRDAKTRLEEIGSET